MSLCGSRERRLLLVLDGPPGAGKSALARRLATEAKDSFPDGQLYVDLREHRRGAGVELSGVVEGFLRSLGVGDEWLSPELDRRVAALRTRLREKRMLILVDHVTMSEQVTRWLPDAPGCVVAVTSNLDLDELHQHGAVRVRVNRLPVGDAVALLAGHCGRARVDAEPDEARQLVELCDRLPLALGVVGARLRRRTSLSLAKVVRELTEAADRLVAIEGAAAVVTAAFDSAITDLPDGARRLYLVLGIHPGTDIAIEVVATALDEPEEAVEQHLELLHQANLVEWVDTGSTSRIRLGELVSRHAAARATAELTAAEHEAVLSRIVRHYLLLAAGADLAAAEDRLRFSHHADDPVVRSVAAGFPDGAAALSTLDIERHNLVGAVVAAADQGWAAEVWQLCEALWPLFLNRKHYRDWVATTLRGVEAGQAVEDPAVEARMRSQLARSYVELRRFEQADEQLVEAAALAERSGHRRLQASVEEFTGRLHLDRGAYARAADHYRRALAINIEVGRTRGAALQRHFLGQALHLSGDHKAALAELRQAVTLMESLPHQNLRSRGNILMTTAKVLRALGRDTGATAELQRALPLLTQAGANHLAAQALEQLADLAESDRDIGQARRHLTAAAEIYTAAGSADADRIIAKLANLGQ
ncbi:NB-ARC domain-containing protein [Lentzea pudingi]|uniref:NB-ARC domain-containing protein n=1 Tax=Lentzea pudingi TaxID=1789439 RepID=UPI00227B1D2B|nr:NB-ARC domain-containing protein [Lentzea pudingi]